MAQATFKNKGGTHVLPDGTTVPPGGVFTADVGIQEKFVNKFERLHEAAPPVNEATDGEKDVTDDFPIAMDNDLGVTRTKAGWVVTADGESLHDEPMLKKEVVPFIEEYIAE